MDGSSGSGLRFRRFLCKNGFSLFQYSLTGKDGSGSGSWKTVPAVPVPLSVSGKTVPTVPVPGSGSVPEPPCIPLGDRKLPRKGHSWPNWRLLGQAPVVDISQFPAVRGVSSLHLGLFVVFSLKIKNLPTTVKSLPSECLPYAGSPREGARRAISNQSARSPDNANPPFGFPQSLA